jgi:hypothetical protein
MALSTLPRHIPTFAAGYCRLLRLIRAMCRVGAWLSPRAAMVLVLVMSCELVWIMAVPEPTARFMVSASIALHTDRLFFHQAPPPWQHGNCFHVASKGHWFGPVRGFRRMGGKVCIMHAENFSAIVHDSSSRRWRPSRSSGVVV